MNKPRKRQSTANGGRSAGHITAKITKGDYVPTGKQRDPTNCYPITSTPDYTDDELEFLKAVEAWKKKTGRQYPACCELLAIAKSLGYRKVIEVEPPPGKSG